MSDLVSRVLSAITERERIAREALGESWDHAADEARPGDGVWHVDGGFVGASQPKSTIAAMTLSDGHARHVAANDPQSVLLLCQAHRDIVSQYREMIADGDVHARSWADDMLAAVARGLGIEDTP